MAETKASEQRGATTNNAVLVAAIKIRRILDELDGVTRSRTVMVLNAMVDGEEVINYRGKLDDKGKQLELAG